MKTSHCSCLFSQKEKGRKEGMRFMTFNIGRYEVVGPNAWDLRRTSLLEHVRSEHADVIALQEMHSQEQCHFLEDGLKDLYSLAVRSTHNTLFIRRGVAFVKHTGQLDSRHRLERRDHVLSQTIFAQLLTPQRHIIVVYNVYLQDTGSQMSQEFHLSHVLNHMRNTDDDASNFVLMGDFNFQRRSTVYRWLLSGGNRSPTNNGLFLRLSDVSKVPDVRFTFHHYFGHRHARSQKGDCQIDFILCGELSATSRWRLLKKWIRTQPSASGRYPSDHFPVLVDLVLSTQQRGNVHDYTSSEEEEEEDEGDDDEIVGHREDPSGVTVMFASGKRVVLPKRTT